MSLGIMIVYKIPIDIYLTVHFFLFLLLVYDAHTYWYSDAVSSELSPKK